MLRNPCDEDDRALYCYIDYANRTFKVPLLSDLKSLCQVSRAVCAISTPALYRDLELEYKPGEGQIDSVWVRRIAGPAMNSTHGGLQFVRNLRANFPDCWPLLLGDLLGSLPDDSLIEFEHRATFTLKSSQYIARMWKHQSNLRNITFTLDLLDFVEQHKTQVEMPKHLNKLVFIGAHIWQLDRLLSSFHFPCLRKVSLEQYGQDLGMDDHTKLDALVSNHLGLLTHLKLRRVGTSGLVGLDLNKLPRLTHLTLIDCSHMHITPSIAAWRKPALTDLHIIISDSRSEFTLMDELSQMLHRFRGLESLALKCNEIMTAETSANLVAGIILHKDTLHRLALNTYNEGPNKNAPKNALNSLSFVLAVKQCKNLTQLQMPFLPDAPLLELVQV